MGRRRPGSRRGSTGSNGPEHRRRRGRDLAVTVYNDNLGLVKDRRTSMSRGGGEVEVTGVAAQLDPTSVHIRPVGNASARSGGQDYRNDLASTDRLSSATPAGGGRPHEGERGPTRDAGVVRSREPLRRAADGGLTMLTRSETQEVRWRRTTVPSRRPTWSGGSPPPASAPCRSRSRILTGGLTWHAEYVAVQSESGTSLDLQGWATVENTSGETYENAREAGRGLGEPGGPVRPPDAVRDDGPRRRRRRCRPEAGGARILGVPPLRASERDDREPGSEAARLLRARGVKTARKYVYDAQKNDQRS